MHILWILVVALMAFFAFGQKKACAEEMFLLHKPMYDRVFACLAETDAVEVAKMNAGGDAVETDILTYAKVRRSKCGVVEAEMVYQRQVWREGEMSVYEATVGEKHIFVLMKGWRADEVGI